MDAAMLEEKDLANLPGRIDPSYVPVQPAGSDVRCAPPLSRGHVWHARACRADVSRSPRLRSQFIKEIAWFNQERQEPVPAIDYVNHL